MRNTLKTKIFMIFTLVLLFLFSCQMNGSGGQENNGTVTLNSYSAAGSLNGIWVFSYSSGKRTSLSLYDAGNNLQDVREFQYDSSGNLLSANEMGTTNTLQGYMGFGYTGNQMTSFVYYSAAGVAQGAATYLTYTGGYLTGTQNSSSGSENISLTSSGAPLHIDIKNSGGVLQSSEDYSYNQNGSINLIYSNNASGTITSYISFEYDNSGNISRINFYTGSPAASTLSAYYILSYKGSTGVFDLFSDPLGMAKIGGGF